MDSQPAEGLTPTSYKANTLRGLGSPHRRPSLRGAGCPAPFPRWFLGPVKCSEVGAAILQTGAFPDRPAVSCPLLLSIPVTQHLPRDTHRNSSCFGCAHQVHPSSPSHWLSVLQSLSNSWSPNDAPPGPEGLPVLGLPLTLQRLSLPFWCCGVASPAATTFHLPSSNPKSGGHLLGPGPTGSGHGRA